MICRHVFHYMDYAERHFISYADADASAATLL